MTAVAWEGAPVAVRADGARPASAKGAAARAAAEEAFDALVRERGPALLRSAHLLCGSWATAQDLVQTALVQTWTHWDAIRDPRAAEAYARRCLVRAHASWWRRRWHREQPTADLPDRPLAGGGGDPSGAAATSQAVLAALARLDPGQRAVLVLRFLDDCSEAETAALLGVSRGTVKSRTSRALARLRALDLWDGVLA